MRIPYFIILLFITQTYLNAQTSIKGKLQDNISGEGIGFANIVLYAKDSTMVKGVFSEDDGSFEFNRLSSGDYFITSSFVGYQNSSTSLFSLTEGETKILETMKIESASESLSEVTVTAQRPLMELKPDKMVFNVEGSVNASGNNALELLQKSPGVIVDNNENVTVLGKTGVQVYIDGRPSPLTGDDLANYLKTLQSSEIDAIEIITNPSAKFDAEGNAGIINIKLKKNKKHGFNTSLNMGYSIGEKARYNGSISSNYRNKLVNLYATLGGYKGENWNETNLYREQFGQWFDNKGISNNSWQGYNVKFGSDFFINDKHTIGFLVNTNQSNYSDISNTRTPIGAIGNERIDSVLVANTVNEGDRLNANFNINYQYKGENDKGLNIDIDYGRYRMNSDEFQPNYYKDNEEEETLTERIYRFETPKDIDIYTFKVDYEQPLGKNKLEIGAKTALVETDNIFDFYNINNAIESIDIDRSNQFIYTENVNAVYANLNRQAGKFSIQLGLRLEQTNSEGDLIAMKPINDENVKRNYIDVFPSAGLSYQLNAKNTFQLSYSRRINRPSYEDLNPFESRLDELTFQKGNPFLNPEYTNSIQLSYSFNYALNTTFRFSHTSDLITRLVDTANETASFITWLNLADQYNYSINISSPLPIKKWWSTYTSITAYHQHNKADFGEGKIVDVKATSFNIYAQQTFMLPHDFAAELSGWYNSPSLWGGTFEMEDMYSIDFGVSKKLFKGKGKLKLSVSDIFNSNNWRGESNFGDLRMIGNGAWDSQRFKVNFSYLFGNEKVKNRNRRTGLEDEENRIKSGN